MPNRKNPAHGDSDAMNGSEILAGGLCCCVHLSNAEGNDRRCCHCQSDGSVVLLRPEGGRDKRDTELQTKCDAG